MDEVSQIKQNLNIVDVIGGYIELKKAGRNYKAVCPFHSEKTASFMVSPELQIYKCFGCGEGGDMFNFVQKMEGVEFPDALEQLAEKAGVKIEKKTYDPTSKEKKQIYEVNKTATQFYNHLLTNHKHGKKALEYLKAQRGLTNKTIKEFNLGYAPNNWDSLLSFLVKKGHTEKTLEMAGLTVKNRSGDGYIDKFRGRVMFPLTGIDGKTQGFSGRDLVDQKPKYLNSPETLVFHKSAHIFGLDKARVSLKKKGAIFVEGQMDVISAFQAGIPNVIATSGTSLTTNQLKILSRYTDEITFAFDSDTAGQNATIRAIELAENENFNINVAIIPDKFADLDELIQSDKDKAKKILKNTVPIYDYFLAVSLKTHNKDTAVGKRKIIDDLAPKFAKIKNDVVLEHYIKETAKELDIKEETLIRIIKDEEADQLEEQIAKSLTKIAKEKNIVAVQEYMLTLLFNSELDLAQNILHKLGKNDFTDEQLEEIFTEYKDYVIGRKHKIDIKYFIDKLDEPLRERAEKIYLIDLGELAENEVLFEKETTAVFNRVKQETISRELTELKKEVKQAELEKNKAEVKKLSEQVYKLSKQKGQYD